MWAPTPPRRSWYQLLASTSLLRCVGWHSWDIAASCISLFSVLSTLAAVWPVSTANVQPVETSCISLFSVLSILAGMWTVSKANAQPAETTTNFFTAETTTWLLFSCNALRSLQIAVSCSSPCAQLTSVTAVTVAVPSAGCGREQSHSHVCPCSSQESGCCSLTSLNICNVP